MLVSWLLSGCAEPPAKTGPSDTAAPDTTDTDTTDTDTAASTSSDCAPDPLPEGWSFLTLSPFGALDLVPGATVDLAVRAVINGGYIPTVALCERWRLDPPAPGVSIDADGVLTVDASVPDGTALTVFADLPDGAVPTQDDVSLSVPVLVYEPALRPWVGVWREEAQIDCETGAERAPEQPIEEIRVRANGDVMVTWAPFELYVDWWGEGDWDLAGGQVSLLPISGNYLPPDIDGEGTFAMEGEDLLLRDLWLGTPRDGVAPAGCGHRLR